ncbi:MAG: hypothetical protein HDT37_08365 [Clostridiales bacterium]|nr:hypothetical protein [Clostridiales bacterium]
MDFLITTNGRKSFKQILLMLTPVLLILTLTGCQTIKETFGKEYRRIDDAFEQLEADLTLTVEEYTAEKNLTNAEQAEVNMYFDQIIAQLHVAKEDMKNGVRLWDDFQKELGTNMSVDAYVEQCIADARVEINNAIKEATNGTVTLKSAKVDRGPIGTIWHFIRNHWLISLIILGIIGAIWEFVEDKFSEWRERKSTAQ